jgi:hypothetical protein
MKSLILAGALSVMASSVFAEEVKSVPEITPYIGVERETKADVDNAYVGATTKIGKLSITGQMNWNNTNTDKNDLDFNLENTDLDFSYGVTNNVSVYLKNDFNADFDRTESVIGAKVTF